MAPPLALHSINLAGATFSIMLPDEYEEIGGVLGIEKLPANATAVPILVTVQELIKTGRAIHIRCSVGARGHLKYSKVLCPSEKIASALGGLRNKTLGSRGTIHHTGFTRRRRRR